MEQYKNLIKDVLENGTNKLGRNDNDTLSVFGRELRVDLTDGFPMITTKYVNFESVFSELIWFLEGSTNERRLAEIRYGKLANELKDKKTIWSPNADAQGVALGNNYNQYIKDLGPIYGAQWRYWKDEHGFYIDQIMNVLNLLREEPMTRRAIVNAWNVADLNKMAIPPCHMAFQFYAEPMNKKDKIYWIYEHGNIVDKDNMVDGKDFNSLTSDEIDVIAKEVNCPEYALSIRVDQRSVDLFLGLPYNIPSYSILLHIFAKVLGHMPKELIMHMGDVHLYGNHIEQAKELLTREPKLPPKLVIHRDDLCCLDFKDLQLQDITLEEYVYHPKLKGKMAV